VAKTINYDRQMKNLIDELSATGHVTHSKYKKKSVTFHHNAGVNISHEEILNLWKSRPVSAHFDIDSKGHAAQYVDEDEYAWAVGNTKGNEETISIELTNSTGSPHWGVSDETWKAGCRLAAWLFVHVIKTKPTHNNVLPHYYWSSTSCPGPYMDKIFSQVVKTVQDYYDKFIEADQQKVKQEKNDGPKDREPTAADDIKMIQTAVGVKADGVWGPKTDDAVLRFRKRHNKR
jgi:hypothetical protein